MSTFSRRHGLARACWCLVVLDRAWSFPTMKHNHARQSTMKHNQAQLGLSGLGPLRALCVKGPQGSFNAEVAEGPRGS